MTRRVRTDYKKCPLCGASLDVGERCDCRDTEKDTVSTPLYTSREIFGDNRSRRSYYLGQCQIGS